MKDRRIQKGVVVEIQAVGTTVSKNLQRRINKMMTKFKRHFANISWADFYIRKSPNQSTSPRRVNVRLGIPGPDVFASDSGTNWKSLLGNVEQKIVQQLKKRKAIG